MDRGEELSWLLDAGDLPLEKEAVTDLVLMRLRAYPERFHRPVDIGGLSPAASHAVSTDCLRGQESIS